MKSPFYLLVLAACTVHTNDNFQNPPPPPPTTCTADTTVTGCTAGSTGYTCTADRPDDGDTNLVCSAGRSVPNGTSFCCLPYAQYFSECTSTTMRGCAEPGFAFACSGAEAPSDADSRLACSASANGDYCCVSTAAAGCIADAAVTCPGPAAGLVCSGSTTPAAGDAPVACTVAGSGERGSAAYCCIPFLQSPSTCEEDDHAGCIGGSFGFTCAGLHRPEEANGALSCYGAPAAGAYCCTL